MHFPLLPRRLRRTKLLVAVVVAAAVSSLTPIHMAESAPEVRIERVRVAALGVPVALPWPSSHVGVRWHGAEGSPVEARWRSAGAAWTGWEAVVESHDLEDAASGRHASGLLSTVDAVEFAVRGEGVHDVDVIAIDAVHGERRWTVASSPTGSPAAASTADPRVAPPSIIGRDSWGADESLRGDETLDYAPVTRFAVHHTAAEEGPDPAATVRAILAYHTEANGWNDIGYNFLVDSAGRVYEGRWARAYSSGEVHDGESSAGKLVTGAHASSNNTGTVGVALLGDFGGVAPSKAALESLQQLLAWKADRHDVDLLSQVEWSGGTGPVVSGHRDIGTTACPGDRLYDLLPTVRWKAHHLMAAARTSNPTLGYWTLGRDSSLYSFGQAPYYGGSGQVPTPVMSIATTPSGRGYWVLSANGRVSPFGDALFLGSTEGMRLNGPVVRLEPTPTGRGYWLLASDGGVFSFGDALFFGSTGGMRLNAPVISMASTVTGGGYWLLAGDGGVFTFGDAPFHGSTGSMRLNAPVASMASAPSGAGYWLQASDGGIFTFGPLRFFGSVPGLRLAGTARTVQIRITPTGEGYYVMGADGGVFTFGDAVFWGAQPGMSGGGVPAVDLSLRVDPEGAKKKPPPPPPPPPTTTTIKLPLPSTTTTSSTTTPTSTSTSLVP